MLRGPHALGWHRSMLMIVRGIHSKARGASQKPTASPKGECNTSCSCHCLAALLPGLSAWPAPCSGGTHVPCQRRQANLGHVHHMLCLLTEARACCPTAGLLLMSLRQSCAGQRLMPWRWPHLLLNSKQFSSRQRTVTLGQCHTHKCMMQPKRCAPP